MGSWTRGGEVKLLCPGNGLSLEFCAGRSRISREEWVSNFAQARSGKAPLYAAFRLGRFWERVMSWVVGAWLAMTEPPGALRFLSLC